MEEFVRHFGIDWKLLLAQTVNFAILLVLLRKFAYGPIVKILRQRREKIEEGLEMRKEAEEKLHQADAMKMETLQRAKTEAFGIVSRGEAVAKERQEEVMQETNKKVESVMTDARRLVEGEKAKAVEEAVKDIEKLVRSGIERVLWKLPPSERDQELVRQALKELETVK